MTGHESLRFRVWVGGQLVREDWLPGASLDAGSDLAHIHGAIAGGADDRGEPWLVEVYDPGAPDDEARIRFGSDVAGMVAPVPMVFLGSEDGTAQ